MKNKTEKSLQETFAPNSICFGCGPANKEGLHVKSFPRGEETICHWEPKPFHEAFPGMLNGGIIGSILDCHCNWTAAWHLMKAQGLDHPPCTVTAEYSVKLLRPTAMDEPVEIVAKIVDSKQDRATIEATLMSKGKVTATCRGVFVAVKPGHPAFHRW